MIRTGIAAGEFRDVEPRLTSLAWLGMHNYTYIWMKSSGTHTAAQVAEKFGDIFIAGLTVRQGAE